LKAMRRPGETLVIFGRGLVVVEWIGRSVTGA
jgi:hypothetical protein